MTTGKVLWKRFQTFIVCSVVALVFVVVFGVQLWANTTTRELNNSSTLVLESKSYGDDCITRQDLENRFSFSQYFLPETYSTHYKDEEIIVYKTAFTGGELANISLYTTPNKMDPKDLYGCFHTFTYAIEMQTWRDPP